MNFYVLIFVLLFIYNSINKALSVQLGKINSKIRPNFDEIFGQKWENGNMENQNEQNDLNSNVNYQNANQFDDRQKSEIIHKFHSIKEGMKKRGKYSEKIGIKIEQKISKKLGINRTKIYKWKKEIGLSRKLKINKKNYYKKKKQEFVERIDEIKRMSKKGKQKQFAKELGISKITFRNWKKEFGIEMGKRGIRFTNEEKARKLETYYQMKKGNPSVSDKEISEFLKISQKTLTNWKKNQISFKI